METSLPDYTDPPCSQLALFSCGHWMIVTRPSHKTSMLSLERTETMFDCGMNAKVPELGVWSTIGDAERGRASKGLGSGKFA